MSNYVKPPIIIHVTNNSDVAKDFQLFGAIKFLANKNGKVSDVIIASGYSDITYEEIVCQLLCKTVDVANFSIHSDKELQFVKPSKLSKLVLKSTDMLGFSAERTYELSEGYEAKSYAQKTVYDYRDMKNWDNKIADVLFGLHPTTWLEMSIPAKTKYTFYFHLKD